MSTAVNMGTPSAAATAQIKEDWDAGVEFAHKALHRTTCLAAFTPCLIATLISVVLAVAVSLIWIDTENDFPVGAFIAVLIIVILLPCVGLCFYEDPEVPASGLPRSFQVTAPKPATETSPGETGCYRNALVTELVTTYKGATTLREVWDNSVLAFGNSKCQGFRGIKNKFQQEVTFTNSSGNTVTKTLEKWNMEEKYVWRTYNQVNADVVAAGAGLWNKLNQLEASVPEGTTMDSKRIGIYASTKGEWVQTAFGAFRHGIPIVTVYATLGVPAVGYAVTQTDVSIMVVDAALVNKLVAVKAGQAVPTGNGDETYDAHATSLRCVVYYGDAADITPESITALEAAGVEVLSFTALCDEGKANPVEDTPESIPTPESIANIQYTSGSTGLPKGVVIKHKHLVSGIGGTVASLPGVSQSDSYIAYLPLAHILELLAELCMYSTGAAVGYASKDTLVASSIRIPVPKDGAPVVKGDAAVLGPTVMAAVPAVMEKIRKGITAKVTARGGLAPVLFNAGMKAKKRALSRGCDTPFWNFLLFDKIRTEALGGRVRMLISGGGPLNKETQQFMNVVFCCPVGQGYGLTETMGGSTVVWPHDRAFGMVGPPTTAVDIKLRDWAEGNYFATSNPPEGEVLISGGTVADGYYQMPEKTASDFVTDPDTGRVWFATGDVGRINSEGVLQIIDRKKDLVKMVSGEYISLGKIESTLALCPFLTAILAYGDGEASYSVAVVTLDLPVVRRSFPALGSVEDMAASEELKKALLADFTRIGKAKGFPAPEIPRKVFIATEEWTPESGLVTASLKLKRKNLTVKYNDDIQALYGRAAGAAAQ